MIAFDEKAEAALQGLGLVCVSGGCDSVVLLHLLAERNVEAIHVHHGLHAQAQEHAEFVERLCEGLGVPVHIARVTVDPQQGEGLEDAARSARYEAIAQRAQVVGARWIATAHHENDQAETLLLRLLRGSGTDGLAGMRFVRSLPATTASLVRPLLSTPRAEIRAYASEHGLEFRTDPTNADVAFQRNRLRADVIPALSAFAPALGKVLGRTAAVLAEDSEALEWLDRRCLAELGDPWSVATLLSWPPAVQARVLRRALWDRRGTAPPSSDVRQLRRSLRTEGPSIEIHLSDGWRARCEGGVLALAREFTPTEVASEVALIPGTHDIHGLQFSWPDAGAPWSFRLATAALVEPVTVGGPRPGDTLRPAGLNGTKKLQVLMIDRKIPASVRGGVLVLRAAGRVLAVLHPMGNQMLAVDEHAQPSNGEPATLFGVGPVATGSGAKG